MKRLLRSALSAATIAVVTLLWLVLARPAEASSDCAGECPSLSVSTATPAAGSAVTVIGTEFGGSDRVTLTLRGATNPLGSAQTNASGQFHTRLTLPSGVAGRRPIVASDPTTDQQARRVLTIATSSIAGFGRATGTHTALDRAYARVAVIGVGALAVVLLIGGGLLLRARRRQHVSV